MLDFSDPKWMQVEGGYQKPVDLRPFLRAVESSEGSASAWAALWQELIHQGRVGVGSYVVVPHLVHIHRKLGGVDWSTYALVASIEVARKRKANPPLPEWLEIDYHAAIKELARLGLAELPRASRPEAVRSILAVLAIAYGVAVYGEFLIEFAEDEAAEIIAEASGEP